MKNIKKKDINIYDRRYQRYGIINKIIQEDIVLTVFHTKDDMNHLTVYALRDIPELEKGRTVWELELYDSKIDETLLMATYDKQPWISNPELMAADLFFAFYLDRKKILGSVKSTLTIGVFYN